ncbi:PREDICTED: putative E3 ubiquitin-protein ligase UNKL isoform X2 [Priapulus caudatus]|uniref:E3 ubiquitin-protein ligase UNKL isoform X2 n=1 Tax=Priapulus caudatus TaxID=37621 RepID=A0ABM1DTB5_PRICU|nr:PREDICTED: putative E3 ubiquitin-protein ligase UNKL isoform X2 [Priapulus caudatus]
MPSEQKIALQAQTENPKHYTYLKEFRTEQCPLFLQHKCTQHRPFTCFHWHFMNQRRRRPIRKRDGNFNYSPDVYCTKYDETTGLCPDGDDCPFLHRTAGDTERRYHLRYYKTCLCVHETDTRGNCMKNGPHCAFAHGEHDLRPPVYDVREKQALESGEEMPMGGLDGNNLEKERSLLNEDPKWQDTNYVLACYKTELCKRPPRLCRQGYACPQYHNSRDRRRSPKKFKYRSTPCPNVKHGDEWGDPNNCESGDNCPYCHTRTEQQFHPEIYKSTKCNDMQQTGYCPRGPFCAFAHVDQEMTLQRELSEMSCSNSLSSFLPSSLQTANNNNNQPSTKAVQMNGSGQNGNNQNNYSKSLQLNNNLTPMTTAQQLINSINFSMSLGNSISNSIPMGSYSESIINTFHMAPIGKPRSGSVASDGGSTYQKAPGSEREDAQASIRKQILAIDNDPALDPGERAKRKQNLCLVHNLNPASLSGTPPTTPGSTGSAMSALAMPFYPPSDTVESVIGLLVSSAPVNIPATSSCSTITNNLSHSPPHSPLVGGLTSSLRVHHNSHHGIDQSTFLCHPNSTHSKYQSLPGGIMDFNSHSMSPTALGRHSPLVTSTVFAGSSASEVQKLREELISNRAKLASWEESMHQARTACEAWKREAEDAMRRAKLTEHEKQQGMHEREEALSKISQLQLELEKLTSGQYLRVLAIGSGLEEVPLPKLKHIQQQMRLDLERVEKAIFKSQAVKCLVCQEKNRTVAILPCNHYVLCETCAPQQQECPYCHQTITQKSSVGRPGL